VPCSEGSGIVVFEKDAAIREQAAKTATRQSVVDVVARFDELAEVHSRDVLIDDLVDVVRWAQTSSIEYLVRGARSKPAEWNLAILFRSVAAVMIKHRLVPAISEYEVTRHARSRRRSLYLRLAAEIAKAAGLALPNDIKGLALRGQKIGVDAMHVGRPAAVVFLKRTKLPA
jgi:hypothetical protein